MSIISLVTAKKLQVVSSKTLGAEQAWDPSKNAAVTKFLDHIAEELAREYVRLMEAAGKDDSIKDQEDTKGSK